MADRIERINGRLNDTFTPTQLEVLDESHLHAGHAGARTGMGHFNVTIVSDRFTNVSLLERHRMVYESLGDLMKTDIHALSIKALAPDELNR